MDEVQTDDTNFTGWRFCETCNNMLIPIKGVEKNPDTNQREAKVYFKCGGCATDFDDAKIIIKELNNTVSKDGDLGDYLEQFLIKRQVFQRTRGADIFNEDMIDDPTMQTARRRCLKCKNDQAKFYLKQDVNRPCIIMQYICCSNTCKFTWNEDDEKQKEEEDKLQLQQLEEEDEDVQNDEEQNEEVFDNQDDDENGDLFDDDENVDQQ